MNLAQAAAYDPLFWLHHSFIDKVWADRQNNPDLPQMTNEQLTDTLLMPFRGNYNPNYQSYNYFIEKFEVEMPPKVAPV